MDAGLRRLQSASRAAPHRHASHPRSGTGDFERTLSRPRRRRRRQPGLDFQSHRRASDDAPRNAAALPPRRNALHRQRDAGHEAASEVMTMKRVTIVFLLMTVAVAAQQPAPSAAVPGHYEGVASCVNSGCHGSAEPLNATRILQNEYYTWLNSDRHAQAYNVLFNDRSARVARNMRLKAKAYQEKICLDCHTTNVPPSLVSGKVDVEDGIQCEACHGPASGWRAEHTMSGWTHEQSVARGMTDLRSLPT